MRAVENGFSHSPSVLKIWALAPGRFPGKLSSQPLPQRLKPVGINSVLRAAEAILFGMHEQLAQNVQFPSMDEP